jgi:hypothetical protein
MSYFEARKGPFALFTDFVWADLSFDAHASRNFDRRVSGNPFTRFPNLNITVDANLDSRARAELEYQSTIVQSGAAYELAKWANTDSRTAFDLLGGARYWNQEVDLSVRLTGDLTINATAKAKFVPFDVFERFLRNQGLELRPATAKLFKRIAERRGGLDPQTVERIFRFEVSRALAAADSGDLEWVDPFLGGRIRHEFGNDKTLSLEGDIGGFGAGSDFSWQVVGTYGFDVNCFGTPFHTVIGYRALAAATLSTCASHHKPKLSMTTAA